MDKLKEKDRFLEMHNLLRLNQEERKCDRLIANKKTEFQQTNSFTGEYYQTFQGELTPILLKLFQKLTVWRFL